MHIFDQTEYNKLAKTGKFGGQRLDHWVFSECYVVVFARRDSTTQHTEFQSVKYYSESKHAHDAVERRFRKDHPNSKGMTYKIMSLFYQ